MTTTWADLERLCIAPSARALRNAGFSINCETPIPFPLPDSAAGFCSLYRPLCISNRGFGNAFALVMPAVAASKDCLLANSSGLLITTVLINSLMVMICIVSALKGAARPTIMLKIAMDIYVVDFLLERSIELPIEFIVKL